MRFEILELFVNTLTTDDKYSNRNIQNLTQQLQTTMSQKQKTFYRIFITYVKSRTSSDDFVKKDESTSLSIYDIIDAEKRMLLKRPNRPCFRTYFANQGLHESQNTAEINREPLLSYFSINMG